MGKKSGFPAVYVRFLNLVRAVRELPDFPYLDPVEARLLDLLAGIWHQGQRVTVLQVIGMSVEVSSTTAHRRLKSLRLKGRWNWSATKRTTGSSMCSPPRWPVFICPAWVSALSRPASLDPFEFWLIRRPCESGPFEAGLSRIGMSDTIYASHRVVS